MKIANLQVSLMIIIGVWIPFGIELEPLWAQKVSVSSQWGKVSNSSASLTGDNSFDAAITQMQRGELSAALVEFEQVLAQRRAGGDRLGEAAVLTQIGKLLAWQGEYEQSVEKLQAALQLWGVLEQAAQQAEALAWLGNSYRLQSKVEQAEASIQEAIALHQSANNPLGEAEALWFLGATIAQQDWSKAAETIGQALKLVQAEPARLEQQQLEGRILSWVGLAAAQKGEAEKAVVDLQKALAMQEEMGDCLAERVTLEILGGIYRRQGKLEASLEAYQESLAIAQVMQVPAVIGRMQNQVGIAHYRLEQYPEALSAFGRATEAYETEEKQREALAQVWSNIGDTHYQQNQLEAMETAYEKAASIYKSVGKTDVLMNHLANQFARELRIINVKAEGQAFLQERDKIQKMTARANDLLSLAQNIDSSYHQVRILFVFAALYGKKHNLEMFNNQFESAIETAHKAQEIHHKTLALINNSGSFSDKQDEINTIQDSLRHASVTTPMSISTAYSRLGQPQESVKFAQASRLKAEELGDEELLKFIMGIEAVAYQTLAGWYESDFAYQEAIRAYQTSLDLTPEEQILEETSSYLVTLISIGQIYEKIGNYDEAERCYQKASEISVQWLDKNTENRDSGYGNFWSQSQSSIASVYASRGEYHRAIDLLESAISKEKFSGKRKDYLLLNNLSSYYVEVGDVQKSEALLEEVIQHYQTEYHNYLEDFNSGTWNFFCENHPNDDLCQRIKEEANPFFRNLLINKVSNQLSVKQYVLALGLSSRGVLQRAQGDYQGALESYQVALRLAEKEEDKTLKAAIRSNQASIYQDQARYQLAYDAIQESLSIAESQQDALAQLQYSRELANMYAEQGRFQEASEIYERNLQTARSIGLRPEEAAILYWIGFVQSRQGNYAKSLASYEQALALQEDMGDKREVAALIDSIGILYRTLGQGDKAIELHQRGLEMSQQLQNKQFIVASLQFLGSAYHAAEQPEQALRYFQQALNLNQDIGNRFRETFILEGIGKLFLEQKQPAQAIAALEKSLTLAQQMAVRPAQARVLGLLGEAYNQQQKQEQALNALQRSLALAQDVENRPTEALTLSRLGNLYAEQSPEIAIALYKQSVNTYETIRGGLTRLDPATQQSYTNTIADTYRALADLLLTQGRLPEAQTVLELLKLQELKDFTRDGNIAIPGSGINLAQIEQKALDKILTEFTTVGNLTVQLNACERDQCPELSKLQQQRDQLFQATRRELKTIRAALQQHFATDLGGLTPEKLNAEARRIVNAQANTALIYPLILQDKIQFLLALKAGDGGVTFRPIEAQNISSQDLFRTIQIFRQQISTANASGKPETDTETVKATGEKLYQWLIQPLEAELEAAQIQNLVIAPDRSTRYIPFGALYDGQQYLAQRFAISTIVAASETDTQEKFPQPQENQPFLLAMGASAFENYPYLAEVPVEIDAIAKTSNESVESGVFPGSEFLNEAFDYQALSNNLKHHRILHIATHGIFKPGVPEDSFLVSGKQIDGKEEQIGTDEIELLGNYGLSNIHLVVLSACDTGVGDRDSSGIEIPGMSYFFLKNDVKSVLASLWSVNDASTSLLMQEFYNTLKEQPSLTKSEAIQAVQVRFIHKKLTAKDAPSRGGIGPASAQTRQINVPVDYSHPYYWAPFILIGNSL